QNSVQAFVLPVISYKQKIEFFRLQKERCASQLPALQTHRRIKSPMIYSVANDEDIFPAEKLLQLRGGDTGYCGKRDIWIPIDSCFEKNDQAIVQDAVNQAWPVNRSLILECKCRPYPLVKGVKDDVCSDCIRIGRIDSRRINKVRRHVAFALA